MQGLAFFSDMLLSHILYKKLGEKPTRLFPRGGAGRRPRLRHDYKERRAGVKVVCGPRGDKLEESLCRVFTSPAS